MPTTAIHFDRETQDFALYLDGELAGFAETAQEAEERLDALCYERAARDMAPLSSVDLLALFRRDPAAAWAQLATLNARQLVRQAVAMAAELEARNIVIAWQAVLERWQRRLAALPQAEAEAAPPEADAPKAESDLTTAPVAVLTVASTTTPDVTYEVAVDGSHCTCPGFRFHGHCKHAHAQRCCWAAGPPRRAPGRRPRPPLAQAGGWLPA